MGAQWEMSRMMTHFIQLKFGESSGFVVEMTTKRNPKAKTSDPDYHNKYTMYIRKEGKTIARSGEREGSNKNYWGGHDYAYFYSTLELI